MGSSREGGIGTRSVASFRERNRRQKFIIVGVGGVAIGFVVYNIIYYLNPIEPRATTSWLLASLIGVWRQHALHRWLTFHDRKGSYAASLGMSYVAYSTSIVASTILNWILTDAFGMNHLIAWAIALGSSVAMNYTMLERFAFPDPDASAEREQR